jgi:hypothetical protein
MAFRVFCRCRHFLFVCLFVCFRCFFTLFHLLPLLLNGPTPERSCRQHIVLLLSLLLALPRRLLLRVASSFSLLLLLFCFVFICCSLNSTFSSLPTQPKTEKQEGGEAKGVPTTQEIKKAVIERRCEYTLQTRLLGFFAAVFSFKVLTACRVGAHTQVHIVSQRRSAENTKEKRIFS